MVTYYGTMSCHRTVANNVCLTFFLPVLLKMMLYKH
jgi:hypothetical protein